MPSAPAQPHSTELLKRLGDRSWTKRRVEELSVIGRHLVLRKVTVVVEVTKDHADTNVGGKEIAYLPLNWYEKRPESQERVFEVVDEQQQVVPALIPQDCQRRVVDELMAAARGLVPELTEPAARLEAHLTDAVRADQPAFVYAYFRQLQAELEKRLARARVSDETRARLLKHKKALLTVVGTVAGYRLLLVPVPADGRPHWYSFEYVSSQRIERLRSGSGFARLAARMGWQPMVWEFGVPGAALTPLLHVLFRAPEGVAIGGSELVAGACPDVGKGDATMHQIDHTTQSCRRSTGAKATFWLEPHRTGLLSNGLVASAIISALLVAGAVRHDLLQSVADKADAAAALLLAVPSFFLLQAVQSFEHRVVSSMLKGLRWTLLAVGLTALVAALLLVATEAPRSDLWWLLVTTALLGTASLAVSFLFGSRASRASPQQPAPEPPARSDDAGADAGPRLGRAWSAAGWFLLVVGLLVVGVALLGAIGIGPADRTLVTMWPRRVDWEPFVPSLLIIVGAAILLLGLGLRSGPAPADDRDPSDGVPPARSPDDEAFLAAFKLAVNASTPRSPMA
jgi:hypothetical protein